MYRYLSGKWIVNTAFKRCNTNLICITRKKERIGVATTMPVFFVYEDLCKNVFYNHVVAQYINTGILKMCKHLYLESCLIKYWLLTT